MLQLSLEMISISIMLECLVFQLYRFESSGLNHSLPATVLLSFNWSVTLRLYDFNSIGEELQLAVSIPQQSNRLIQR